MKNLFETDTYNEIMLRIDKLKVDAPRQWGKMNVNQMLAHCSEPLYLALGEKQGKRSLMSLIFGKMAKKIVLEEKAFKQSLPTDKNFIIAETKDFSTEKEKLKGLVARLYAGKETMPTRKHHFFGQMTPDEWARSMYKHIDHHLTQFGV